MDLCRRKDIEDGLVLIPPDSEGSQVVAELLPSPSVRLNPRQLLEGGMQSIGSKEWIMYKPRWGAFYKTPLEDHLRQLGVTTLVMCGCNFPNCPRNHVV